MNPHALSLRSRQFLLFTIAIVVPCTLLVLLTVRMLIQDRELAERRVEDERRRIAADARQTLLTKVERLRLTANDPSTTTLPAELALVARVEGGRLVLPWERATAASPAKPPRSFSDLIRRGEQLEFGESRFADAAEMYQRASQAGTDPGQRAAADLLNARALAKSQGADAARRAAQRVVALPPDVVDDQGIPFALYAARLLTDWGKAEDHGAAGAALDRVLAQPGINPAALYMTRDLSQKIGVDNARNARIAQRVDDLERALELRGALPTLGLPASSSSDDPVWISFGPADSPWLVSLVAVNPQYSTLTALRAREVFAAMPSSIAISMSKDGEPLAPAFPTLAVTISPETMRAIGNEAPLRRPFYLAALALVVGVALAGAYLFWRDADREVRMAALRSQFVSSVSHELKTPLTAIRMFAETLLMGRATEPQVQADYLQTIVGESERLTRLLNNVLDFSKIESGGKAYHLENQSLAEVVRAAARAVHYPFSQHGFDLRVAIDDAVPRVAIDADAIEQAILNLLSNAMKYSGEARAIRLSLGQENGEAVISVADDGVGIPPAEQRRIFEKFYRVRNGATERVAGAGLGLTLVDHVMRGHGGRVTLRSEPGAGSTFMLHLPVLAAVRESV